MPLFHTYTRPVGQLKDEGKSEMVVDGALLFLELHDHLDARKSLKEGGVAIDVIDESLLHVHLAVASRDVDMVGSAALGDDAVKVILFAVAVVEVCGDVWRIGIDANKAGTDVAGSLILIDVQLRENISQHKTGLHAIGRGRT